MNEISVSVIIPVFNTEQYLRQCLDSVIHQTLKNIEIICINDGSTDSSLAVLQEYARKDSRIRIINKQNGGQGLARNMAIQIAHGEYLSFVDSDDWVEPDMFQNLYESAKRFDTEITICEFKHFHQGKGIITLPDWIKLPIDSIYENQSFSWNDIKEIGFKINSAPTNKIYKSKFVLDNNIEFATGVYYQDIVFVYKSLILAEKISLVRKPLYTYRYARSGSTTSDKGVKQFDIFTVLNLLQSEITETGNFEAIKKFFFEYKFSQYLYHLSEVNKKYKNNFWHRIKSEFNELGISDKNEFLKTEHKFKMGLKFGLFFYNNYEQYIFPMDTVYKLLRIEKIKNMFKSHFE